MSGNKVISSTSLPFSAEMVVSEKAFAIPMKIFANHSWLRFNSGCEMANLIENSLNGTGRALVMKNATIAL
jgi:hypothetical protein